ncbi:hypothetical protein KQH81_10985 [Clostridium cadaveris]|uniref:hypothetical protein n=1 Tax=Clostridium cadaveris TaxID=1529 RepID=UPI001E40EE4A|nr:hypothetical protein [Clostridium cadaveris]UFH63876.1 hypothetical protein KQH81_10985 [Clostridium cadaveris]
MDIIKNAIIYTKENISWIKDIFTIILTFSATIISYFTYQKAKKSLLQPMKSEVIHIQTNMMIDLINYINDEFNNKLYNIYLDIVCINLFNTLIDCGYIFNNQEKIKAIIKEKKVGAIPIADENGIIKSIEVISTFKNESETCDEDVKKENYENLQNGNLHIDMIFFTKEYLECNQIISKYISNPLMPQKISDILEQLLDIINNNLKLIIKKTIEESVIEYYKLQEKKSISHTGVYNEFNHNRIEHEHLVKEIRREIRKFLKVDEEWQ